MKKFIESVMPIIKKVVDMLCISFGNAKKQHSELVELAQQMLKITHASDWERFKPEERKELVDAIVSEYEIFIGIKVYDPDIVEKRKESEYWLYKAKSNPEQRHDHFDHYKQYLMSEGFSLKIVQNIESTCEKILARSANPKTTANLDQKKGLVIGDVQSGKTANYLGLINMAYDYGYKIVVLLAGTTNSLRVQTQKRTDYGAIGAVSNSIGGAKTEYVGVGEISNQYYVIPLTDQTHDFGKLIQETSHSGINDLKKPVILVVKKNKGILDAVGKKLQSTLDEMAKKVNGSFDSNSILIIDDEADNASINTRRDPSRPTVINRCIREIFNNFPVATYVGFTATPFANIFINSDDESLEKKDLFPSDFIVQLHTPSNYFGGRKIFPKNDDEIPSCIRLIDETEENFFPVIHSRDARFDAMAESLKHAIHCFLINNVIRTIRGQKTKHRSMMINITRYNDVQQKILWKVQEYVEEITNAIEQSTCKTEKEFTANDELRKIHDLFLKDEFYRTIRNGSDEYEKLTWKRIQSGLLDEIRQIQIVVINSRNGNANKFDRNGLSKRFDYDDYKKDGARVIAIGGLVLSRGLTLEGLMVSYYSRNAAAYDTLLQMCRWFGYRPKYEDLCRIYMTQTNMANFSAVLDAVEDLKEQFKEMERQGKKPEDFGLMVRESPDTLETTLLITSRNKMRNSEDVIVQLNYGGIAADTSKLDLRSEINEINKNAVIDFLNKIEINEKIDEKYIGKKNVEKSFVAEFISKLKIPYVNKKFDVDGLSRYIAESKVFAKWDIVVANGDSKDANFEFGDLRTPAVCRQFHFDNQNFRIGRNNNRVMEPSIFKFGLTAEQLQTIEKKHKEEKGDTELIVKELLCEERERPLLVIYPIDLKSNYDKDKNNEGIEKQIDPQKEEKKAALNGNLLFAFAIGFPKKESSERLVYRANMQKIKELTDGIEVDDDEEGEDDND